MLGLMCVIQAKQGKCFARERGREATNIKRSINTHLLKRREDNQGCNWRSRRERQPLFLSRDIQEKEEKRHQLSGLDLEFFSFSSSLFLIVFNSYDIYNEIHDVYDQLGGVNLFIQDIHRILVAILYRIIICHLFVIVKG